MNQSFLPPLFVLVFFHLSVWPWGASCNGQPGAFSAREFSRADSLRGSLGPERSCYDVTFYGLELRVDPAREFIEGAVEVRFRAISDFSRLQIDLYPELDIYRIRYRGQELTYQREYGAVFIDFPEVAAGEEGVFRVEYGGQPRVAVNPPWDGGFVWSQDRLGRPWVGVACQGAGASLWWPNKDHLSDEPDSMSIRLTVPDSLMGVANGQLVRVEEQPDWTTYHWRVSYPINNYAVSVNVARYAHWSEEYYSGEDGDTLALDYYVLYYNRRRARQHFRQVEDVLSCYEHYLGKYPFWEDGYALVETPYLGMEHQSGIAYGNKYLRGYLGGMIPEDMDWDYIIVHESGHEYFGNALSVADMAEMWLNESFTTYLESLFVECMYGPSQALDYLRGQRYLVQNREPILGPAGVNWDYWATSDHYYKGALMLHTLRHAIGTDSLWFDLLRTYYDTHRYGMVSTRDFLQLLNQKSGKDFGPVLEQYLEWAELPVLEYQLLEKPEGLVFKARWSAAVQPFSLPVHVRAGGELKVLEVGPDWQEFQLPGIRLPAFSLATEYGLYETRTP